MTRLQIAIVILMPLAIIGACSGRLLTQGGSLRVEREDLVLLRAEVVELRHQAEASFRMLQRICSNTAKDDTERQHCFDR